MDAMESRSQIDILQNEDATLLALSQEVDDHSSQLRRAVLETVRSMRAKLHQQAMDIVEGERGRSRDNEKRLLEQVDRLQKLVDQRTNDLEREREFSERLLVMHKRQRDRLRAQALVQEGLRRWRGEVRSRKHCERAFAAIVNRRKERLLRAVVVEWRMVTMKETFRAAVERVDGEHRRNIARLTADHQTSENAMKLEVLSMKESLAKEEERRAILEERLKAAFMRGVCALNMEAMHVLRGAGSAADGDVSVASLLQGMNLGSSSDSLHVEAISSPDGLFRQQQALQAQINAMHIDAVEGATKQPVPSSSVPVPTAAVTHHHASQYRNVPAAPAVGASGVVTINPYYPGLSAAPANTIALRGSLATGQRKPPVPSTSGTTTVRRR
jgi:hypothetical protein